eukprot:GHVS01014082.1.p1 GENE.GHVS01014082.1~~GHVS01014082.1.p1  ORF type:complete len:110 (-),score=14.15 GHVS01014082.1:160-489(-)
MNLQMCVLYNNNNNTNTNNNSSANEYINKKLKYIIRQNATPPRQTGTSCCCCCLSCFSLAEHFLFVSLVGLRSANAGIQTKRKQFLGLRFHSWVVIPNTSDAPNRTPCS